MFLTKQTAQPTASMTSTPAVTSSALHATLQLPRGQFPYHDHDSIAQAVVSGYMQLTQQQPALKFYSSEHGTLTVKVLLPINIFRLMSSLQTQLMLQSEAAFNRVASQLQQQRFKVIFAPDNRLQQDQLTVVFGSSNLQPSDNPSIWIRHKNFELAARANTNAIALDDYLLTSLDSRLQGRLGDNIIVFEHTADGHVAVHAPNEIALSWPADDQVELFFSAERRLVFNVKTGPLASRPKNRCFFVQPKRLVAHEMAEQTPAAAQQETLQDTPLSFSAVTVDDESLPKLTFAAAQQRFVKVTLQAVASAGRSGAGPFSKATMQTLVASENIQRQTGITELTVIGSSKSIALRGDNLQLTPQHFAELPAGLEININMSDNHLLVTKGWQLDGETLTAINGVALPFAGAITVLLGPVIMTLEPCHD